MSIECKAIFTKKVYSGEDGYAVYSAKLAEDNDYIQLSSYNNFSISGDFSIEQNDLDKKVFTINVEPDYSGKYQNSYNMVSISFDFPSTSKEQWAFLRESNLVTQNRYTAIKNTFPSNTLILDLIMDHPDYLVKVPTVGEKLAKKIHDKLVEEKDLAAIYQAFGDVPGVGPGVILGIQKLGTNVNETINKIKIDPFYLMKIPRVGFLVADKVRAFLKVPLTDRNRCLHGVKHYILDSFLSTGNTYADLNKEIYKLADLLYVNVSLLVQYVKEESEKNDKENTYGIKIFGNYISTIELYEAEKIISKKISYLMRTSKKITNTKDWNNRISKEMSGMPQTLSDEQQTFLKRVNEENVLLLVGPGGSGKSWVTELTVRLLKQQDLEVTLVAPTARAAKVMTNYIHQPASTIHRAMLPLLFATGEEEVKENEEDKRKDADVIIIDESSMVDSELMSIVLKVSKDARIIIIGDSFQLPSVGPGNVLYDLIHSLKVPMVEFTKIYRQGKDSNIINYAAALRTNSFHLENWEDKVDAGDIVFINEKENETIADLAINFYSKDVKRLGEENLMILSPVNKGPIGRRTLNPKIQKIVNGNERLDTMSFGENSPNPDDLVRFRVDDYITVIRNNYNAQDTNDNSCILVNGDVGKISHVTDKTIVCDIDDLRVPFLKNEVKSNIEHLWATTIHKSQGGQADTVIILIPKNSWGLSANMLYTAITRAKVKCLVIGDFNAMNRASKVFENYNRRTMLSLNAQLAKEATKNNK